MEWKELGAKIARWAPELGATIGSIVPGVGTAVGGAAGLAIKALAGAFGLTETVTPEMLDMAIGQDPQSALTLKLANMNFLIEMRKLDIQELDVHLKDVQSARERQVGSEKATGRRDINLYILAYLYVAGFFVSTGVMIWAVCNNRFPEDLPQAAVFLLGNLFGALTAGVGAVVQYFFGSSKSSADKTALLTGGKH